MRCSVNALGLTAAVLLGLAAPPGKAAEGFQVRYNLAGTLAIEMFRPVARPGWVGGLTFSHADIRKITGPGGDPLTLAVPGGTVPLPAPAPPALYGTYGPTTAQVHATGRLRQWNLMLGYLTAAPPESGRWLLGVNLPWGVRDQVYRLSNGAPPVQWQAAVPAPARAAAGARFNASYAAALEAAGAAETGEATGFGDLELQTMWVRTGDRLRIATGAALVLPTGKYDAAAGPDISLGDFTTLRPSVQATWHASAAVDIAAKLLAGINSRNDDSGVRSGNWVGLEGAAGWRSPIGVLGVQAVRLQQVQDDSGGRFGANRFRSTTAGLFYTVPVAVIDGAFTVQYASTVASRNARHGSFLQLRLISGF
ncbi:transporter [Ramlibacter sp. AN1015]|uniref:transporter n=1 Tax=Ramlibacter sp. AN1015 TaxID=3133428 RepID=UPI0030C628BE